MVKDRGEIDARDVKAGDLLPNPKTGGYAMIEQVVQGPEKNVVELHFLVGGTSRSSRFSFGHIMVTKRGYIRASDVRRGDHLLRTDGSWVSVASIKEVPAHHVINFVLNPNSRSYEDHLVASDGLVTGDLWLQTNLGKKK